jgi:hypothetical protein
MVAATGGSTAGPRWGRVRPPATIGAEPVDAEEGMNARHAARADRELRAKLRIGLSIGYLVGAWVLIRISRLIGG